MNYWWILGILIVVLFVFSYYKKYKLLKNMDKNSVDSPNLIILNDSNYKKQIKTGVSIIDFWAPWCMPCKVQGPIINEVADEMAGKANICKINIDENKKAAAEFGIRSIPTILIFRDGKILKKLTGLKSKSVLIKNIQSNLI